MESPSIAFFSEKEVSLSQRGVSARRQKRTPRRECFGVRVRVRVRELGLQKGFWVGLVGSMWFGVRRVRHGKTFDLRSQIHRGVANYAVRKRAHRSHTQALQSKHSERMYAPAPVRRSAIHFLLAVCPTSGPSDVLVGMYVNSANNSAVFILAPDYLSSLFVGLICT